MKKNALRDSHNKIVNEHDVKRELDKKKVERQLLNVKQVGIYRDLLGHLNSRNESNGKAIVTQPKNNPHKLKVHEKERSFLEAMKIVISSGYTIEENDFLQILQFV
jgi:hypothetical protein